MAASLSTATAVAAAAASTKYAKALMLFEFSLQPNQLTGTTNGSTLRQTQATEQQKTPFQRCTYELCSERSKRIRNSRRISGEERWPYERFINSSERLFRLGAYAIRPAHELAHDFTVSFTELELHFSRHRYTGLLFFFNCGRKSRKPRPEHPSPYCVPG